MNRTEHNPEALLDAAIAEVAEDGIDPQAVEASRRNVWARIMAEAHQEQAAPESAAAPKLDHIRSCADFQALLPEYRAGQLSPGRRMLLEDHVHECVACRKAMYPETQRKPLSKVVEMPHRAWTPKRWAIAAMLLVGVGSSVWFGYDRFGPAPEGSRAKLIAVNGAVYRLAGGELKSIHAGADFAEGDRIRTSTGATAVLRLMDGSTVEVGERAEFGVEVNRRNTTVQLGRGSIIVQAAKRSRGHLYVNTGDSRVAVTGTVFSVNRGVAGSRVSVIEGSVVVEQGDDEHVLKPGDQRTTHPSIARVGIAEEIAWSKNLEQHLALLKQFVDMKDKLNAVQLPTLRYSSRLLDAVPEGTTIYISVPNLSRAVVDVQRIVSEQAKQSPEMQQWLEHGLPHFQEFATKVAKIGDHIGEEVTFAFQSCAGFCGVAIAEVHRPGLKEVLQKEIADSKAPFLIVEGSNIPATRKGELIVDFVGNKIIIGEQAQFIAAAAKGGSSFSQSGFGQAIAERYRRGTGVLVALDLERMVGDEVRSDESRKTRSIVASAGIDKVKYLVAEQRTFDSNRTEYVASVNFDTARRGIASWLAEPGAMGSLSFVSPGAQFAASLVVKDPVQLLDEVLPLGKADLENLQRDMGIDLKQDLASALGGEVTFAFDGPMLPTPSWKIILEVNDPAKLQATMEKLLESLNRQLERQGLGKVQLASSATEGGPSQGVATGRNQTATAYVLKTGKPLVPEVHYAFVDGYMVITPSSALLARSVSDRVSGISLTKSRRFTRLLPRDQQPNFSAMIYQNAGELLGLIAQGGAGIANVPADQQRRAEELASKMEPMLVCLYGEPDRITMASQGSAWDLLMNSVATTMFGQSGGTRAQRNAYR